MDPPRPILRVGLTGGIASGKSTVAAIFAEHGAFILDADRISHELILPEGAAYREVVQRFGPSIVMSDGTVDRTALGRIVFSDAEARVDLNAIVHPRVREEIHRRIDAYASTGHGTVAMVDAALLVESGIHETLHRLIVVRCSRDSQIRRLLSRAGLTAAEAEARIEAQAPLESKLAVASYVIDTDTTLHETRAQADRVWAALRQDFEQECGPPGSDAVS